MLVVCCNIVILLQCAINQLLITFISALRHLLKFKMFTRSKHSALKLVKCSSHRAQATAICSWLQCEEMHLVSNPFLK